jgi:hypothetical protein
LLLPVIPDGTYGPATVALKSLIEEAAGIAWFPPTNRADDPLVLEYCRRALRRMADLFPDYPALAEMPVDLSAGTLAEFDQLSPTITDTEGWGDPMAPTPWGQRLHRLADDVRTAITTTPELHALVVPPLWPHGHLINVVGSALFESPPPPELQVEPRWAMLSHVQYNFHHTLEWALALPHTIRDSPFYLIWQCHRAGYYPLGIFGARFRLFTIA